MDINKDAYCQEEAGSFLGKKLFEVINKDMKHKTNFILPIIILILVISVIFIGLNIKMQMKDLFQVNKGKVLQRESCVYNQNNTQGNEPFSMSGCKKWNPGHYILLTKDTTQEEVEEIISNQSNYIKGVQIGYLWHDLEPEKDVYNFSLIEEHLNIIKKYNKQLFVSFSDRNWRVSYQAVPNYLLTDPVYQGGVEPMVVHEGSSIARLWDPLVMERSNKLIEAMGRRFDNEFNFEGINFDESSLDINTITAVGYSNRAYADALISRADSAAKAFPNSTVIMYMNYGPQELICVIYYLSEIGIGIGGPDLVPDQGRFSYKLRTPAYEYYPALSGKVPLGTAVQSENLVRPEWYDEYCTLYPENTRICVKDKYGNYVRRKGNFTLDGFWDMGLNTLKLNYIFWQDVKGDRYKFQFKEDILPYINERDGKINNNCSENPFEIEIHD